MISTLILNVNLPHSLFGFQTSMTQKIGQIANGAKFNCVPKGFRDCSGFTEPIRCQAEINRHLVAPVFPRCRLSSLGCLF